ncbi:MAG: 16S rRNA (guanine(527)-N(7))-methyltransferase RsmG [Clostridiales bacterium]|nr:16S rRNA (guanine(527)-N(7))-methyltransferase RsmG [Clostridiales bacterium]
MNTERLRSGLARMGIPANEAALERFFAFHALLDEANRHMDLTAILSEDESVDRHDLDSAVPLCFSLLPEGARVIDVGTGAGFPGMPLLILRPDLRMTFLDAQQKRVRFLEQALSKLGLPGTALHARAEDAARLPEHRDAYDRALSRAVAASPVLMELTLPFVRPGGMSVAWKGPAAAAEFAQAKRAAFLLGAFLREPLPAPIPNREDWAHVLLIADKKRPTSKLYPRKAGTPAKKPLG